jgi:hypothetical protein
VLAQWRATSCRSTLEFPSSSEPWRPRPHPLSAYAAANPRYRSLVTVLRQATAGLDLGAGSKAYGARMAQTIRVLARKFCLRSDTPRYYERVALLHPTERTASGYRVDDEPAVEGSDDSFSTPRTEMRAARSSPLENGPMRSE